MTKRRVLFVAPECPWPCNTGLRNHSLGMLRCLLRTAEVTVVGYCGGPDEREAWRRLAGQEGFALGALVERPAGARLALKRLAALARGLPLSCAGYDVPEIREAVSRAAAGARLAGRGFDRVIFEMFWTLMAAPDLPAEKIVLFPVDGYRLYWRRMAASGGGWVGWLRARYLEWAFSRLERSLYRRVPTIITVARDDAQSIAAGCPGAQVEVLPVPLIRPLPPPGGPRRPEGVLVGGYFHTPSIAEDTRRFLAAWARQDRSARLVVWGRGARAAGMARAARTEVTVTEWVEDADALMGEASIFVYPQRFACGIQTKIQEAMAAGLCVIAGPEVLGPVGARPGVEAILADGPREAAEALAALLGQPDRVAAIGAAARRLAESRFSTAAIACRLAAILDFDQEEVSTHEDLLHC